MENKSDIQEFRVKIQRGLLDSKKRQLILNADFIKFENKDSLADTQDPFTVIDKNEIIALRYGIKWIQGYIGYFGREYQIFILSKNNGVLKIYFKTFYGIRKKELHKLFSEIIDALWEFYFRDIANNLLDKLDRNEEIEIGRVRISQSGVTITTYNFLKERKEIIPWEKVGVKSYQTYYAIFSKENPAKINAAYYYLNDWNTGVLYSIVQSILKKNGLVTD